MRTLTLALLTCSLLACNNGGGDDSTATTSGSSSTTAVDPTTTTAATPASTTAPDDTTTAGTGTGSASEPVTESGDPTSESATTEPATTEPATTGPVDTTSTTEPVDTTGSTTAPVDTEGTTAGTTGAPVDCAMLGPKQCMADEACMPLGGGKLNLEKMCVQKQMFLGCVEAGACGDALTYGCDSMVDPPEPFLFPSTCLPDGWEVCEAPAIDKPC